MEKMRKGGKKINSIILFGYINEPPDGGGGGGGGGGEGIDNGSGGTLPSGTISTDGQEQRGTTFFAPPITSFVRFRYRSVTPVTGWTAQTRALGDWKTKSGPANFTTYTTIDVPIDASNYNVSIRVSTLDSNGGTFLWQAMHS